MPNVLVPHVSTNWYSGKGNVSSTHHVPTPLVMLNARYGMLKTEDTMLVYGKRLTYTRDTVEYLRPTDLRKESNKALVRMGEKPIEPTPANMWTDYIPVFSSREVDKHFAVFEIIDTETGFVICSTTKNAAKEFMQMWLKIGYTFTREYPQDIKVPENKYSVNKKIVKNVVHGEYVGTSYTYTSVKRYGIEN